MTNAIPDVVRSEVVTITNFVAHDITGLEIVGKVNDLYSSTLSHLLTIIGIIVAIGAIGIPYVSHLFQRKEARLNLIQLKGEIAEAVIAAKRDLDNQNLERQKKEREEIQQLLNATKHEMQMSIAQVRGFTSHMVALINLDKKWNAGAAAEALGAIRRYCECKDHENLLVACNFLVDSVLPLLNKEDFEQRNLKLKFDKMEQVLNEENKTGFLTAIIDKISTERKAAAKREK